MTDISRSTPDIAPSFLSREEPVVIIREHVFNNTPASDKCTVPGCGVAYAERLGRVCQERMASQRETVRRIEIDGIVIEGPDA
jgi:hypothetical protein